MRIVFSIDNEALFDRTFTRFTEQLRDLRDIWPSYVTALRQIMREQYAGQGVGVTGQWAALSPRYAEWKAKKYPGKPILQATGRTVASLTGNTKDSIATATPDELLFGTKRRGQIWHQRGGKQMPQRKIFDFTEPQKATLTKAIQRRLLVAGRNSGFQISQ